MTSSYSHCSSCGSWVMDREFVIWVSLCSMVVIRWVLPCLMVVIRGSRIRDLASLCWFHRARWRDMVLGWLCSVVLGYEWLFRFLGWLHMVLGVCITLVRVAVSVFRLAWYGAGWLFRRSVGFWVQRWRDRDERQRQRRESQIKYYYFFTILATVQFYV